MTRKIEEIITFCVIRIWRWIFIYKTLLLRKKSFYPPLLKQNIFHHHIAHSLLGYRNSNWSSSMQISPNLQFHVILQVDIRWPLTLICDLWLHEHMKVSIFYQWKMVQIRLPFQMTPFSNFQSIFQLDLRWLLTLVHDLWLHEHVKFTYYINKPSLVQVGLKKKKRKRKTKKNKILKEYSVILTAPFYGINQKILTKKGYFQNFS